MQCTLWSDPGNGCWQNTVRLLGQTRSRGRGLPSLASKSYMALGASDREAEQVSGEQGPQYMCVRIRVRFPAPTELRDKHVCAG